MIWLAAFGWIVASRRRGHVRIRFFHDLLRNLPWRVTEALIQLGMIALGAIVAWYGIDLVVRNFAAGGNRAARFHVRGCMSRSCRPAWSPSRRPLRELLEPGSPSTRGIAAGRDDYRMTTLMYRHRRGMARGDPGRRAAVRLDGAGGRRVRLVRRPLGVHRAAEDGAGDELLPARRGAAVHPDGQSADRGQHHRPDRALCHAPWSVRCAAAMRMPASCRA